MRKLFSSSFWALLVAVILVAGAFGQETTGGIEGQVKDTAGALVPNVTLTVTDTTRAGTGTTTIGVGSGFRRTITTN